MTLVVRRSELATPATNSKLVASAMRTSVDLVFLDLEDAVAPTQKPAAREQAVEALLEPNWIPRARAIRINSIETQWAYRDIVDVVSGARDRLDTIVVPKVKSGRDVWWVSCLLDQLEADLGIQKPIRLEVLIEEAEAVLRAEEIALSSDRLDALIFGAGDLSASQGARVDVNFLAPETYPGDMWHFARSMVVLAARTAGIAAIDAPFPDFSDADGYRSECERVRTLGFNGKWAIHPSQIVIATDVFSPALDEVERARKIIELCEDMDAAGQGSMTFEGAMLDIGAIRAARQLVEYADSIRD